MLVDKKKEWSGYQATQYRNAFLYYNMSYRQETSKSKVLDPLYMLYVIISLAYQPTNGNKSVEKKFCI